MNSVIEAALRHQTIIREGVNRRITCPSCSPERKNKRDKTLSVKRDGDRFMYHCFHCEEKGFLDLRPKVEVKAIAKQPEPKKLTVNAIRFLNRRGISRAAAESLGVYSTEVFFRKLDRVGEAIGFPYYNQGRIYASKLRCIEKKDHSQAGSCETLWGIDHVADTDQLTIVEGELDVLAAVTAGLKNVVSVPGGAPDSKPVDIENDRRFSFIQHSEKLLDQFDDIYLAGDGDRPGEIMIEELARRLGKHRCWRVKWPDPHKDCGAVLQDGGSEAVGEAWRAAERFPVAGLYEPATFYPRVDTLFLRGAGIGKSTGYPSLDSLFTVVAGSMTVVTGLPGSGKSEFMDQIAIKLADREDWPVALVSPENEPDFHLVKLIQKRVRKQFFIGSENRMSKDELEQAKKWIAQRFVFGHQADGSLNTVSGIMERLKAAVVRYGVRMAVVDPTNYIEVPANQKETQWVSDTLSKFRAFAQHHDVAMFLVAHPAKLYPGRDGTIPVADGHTISGCYSEDTEVLTHRGWVQHNEVTLFDRIACFDSNENVLTWDNPSHVHRYDHEGPMHHYRGRGMDLLVTPNHRMVVKPMWPERESRMAVGAQGGVLGAPVLYSREAYNFVTSENLSNSIWQIPTSAAFIDDQTSYPNLSFDGTDFDPIDMMRYLGWYISEGWAATNSPAICQAVGNLQEQMKATLDRMGVAYSDKIDEPQGKGIQRVWRARVLRGKSPEFADFVMDNCGRDGRANKRLPGWFITTPEIGRRALYDALIEGDGSKDEYGHEKYHTTSPALADQVQRLAISLGRSACVSDYGRAKDHHLDRYVVYIRRPNKDYRRLSVVRNRDVVEYVGNVWCLTVPTGAYVTRRNGRMAICGNSAHWFNKADFGLTVTRPKPVDDPTYTKVHCWKARHSWAGKVGTASLGYDERTTCYEEL